MSLAPPLEPADLESSHATLIYNPVAGFADWERIVHKVANFWEEAGWTIHLRSTEREAHATELARSAAAAGHALALAAGGDGTLNEVANGLAHSRTALAPLPVGTANSFARELGLPRPNLFYQQWLLDVSRSLLRGKIHQIDMGKCDNGRYWMLWASTGIDGFIVKKIEPRPLWFKRLGAAGYAAKALFFLPQFQSLNARVTVDDHTVEDDCLLVNVSNCRLFIGGELPLNSRGVLDDGIFEVWLFRGKRWPKALAYALEVGLENHVNDPKVDVLRCRSVRVEADPPTPYHLDGEVAGTTPFACTLEPLALRILVPETSPTSLFSRPGIPLPTRLKRAM